MLRANWPYVVIIGLLVFYFSSHSPRMVWPDEIVFWAWPPYVVHLLLHNFVDGFQNTTRNIARIVLIRDSGKDYDPGRVAPIQMALVPAYMAPVTLVWFAVHIGAFAVLLYFQGWGTAVVAEVALAVFGWVLPIHYLFHLGRLAQRVDDPGFADSALLGAAAVSPADVRQVVVRALKEKRNPQEWWAALM